MIDNGLAVAGLDLDPGSCYTQSVLIIASNNLYGTEHRRDHHGFDA